MPLPRFNYLAPKTLKEASALLAEHGDRARLMAGGTDLLIRLGQRAMSPDFIIGLRGLPGLDGISFSIENGLVIGALARLADVADHPEVLKRYPALSISASSTATVQVRNMGTVVGNICNAAPSADNATPLLVYDAMVHIIHPGGERKLALNEFFRGPGLTALEQGEIVKEIVLPVPGPLTGSDYQKLSERSKVDIAAVGVASFLSLDEAGVVDSVKIALGAVAPTPLRARRAEDAVKGQKPTDELFAKAAEIAAEESSPITDLRAGAEYRRKMVGVLTKRALTKSFEIASRKPEGCEI